MPQLHRTISSAPTQRTTRLSARLAGATTLAVVAAGLGAGAAHAAYTPEVWDAVAQCESSGNWQINTGNGYYGGLQFYHPTWKAYGGQEFAGYAHQASKAEQIAIGRRVLHAQGPGAWPVCSVRAGLTRDNGGADPNAQPGDEGQAPAPVTRYVSASTAANIRTGPGTSYRVVDSAVRGTEVSGTLTSNGWLKIATDRYISGTVLSANPVDGGGTAPAPAPGEVTRYVSANYAANVRSGPGNGYSIIGSEARGAKVTGTLTSTGWLNMGSGRYIGPTVLSSTPV